MCDSIYESEWIVKLWIRDFISAMVVEEVISSVNQKITFHIRDWERDTHVGLNRGL